MSTLNKQACETARAFRIHAATDITGFGLAGHALGMAKGAGVRMRFRYESIPRYPWAVELIRRGMGTKSTAPNAEYAEPHMEFLDSFSKEERTLLFDPQTSGGLLLSVHPEDADGLLAALVKSGCTESAIVGDVEASETPSITVAR